MISVKVCKCASCTQVKANKGRLELVVGANRWHMTRAEAKKLKAQLGRLKL